MIVVLWIAGCVWVVSAALLVLSLAAAASASAPQATDVEPATEDGFERSARECVFGEAALECDPHRQDSPLFLIHETSRPISEDHELLAQCRVIAVSRTKFQVGLDEDAGGTNQGDLCDGGIVESLCPDAA
jgi:hypothetical protein